MHRLILVLMLLSTLTAGFLKQDFQTDYISLIGQASMNNYTYTYQFQIPFRNSPSVMVGLSALQINPSYNYMYYYVSCWNSGDLGSEYLYFSSWQISKLNIYILAVDLTSINFVNMQTNVWWWSQTLSGYNYNTGQYNTGDRYDNYNVSFNKYNSTPNSSSNSTLLVYPFLSYIDIGSPDNIVFDISTTQSQSPTYVNATLTFFTTGNCQVWGLGFSVLYIDVTTANNFGLSIYSNIFTPGNSLTYQPLTLTFAGVSTFNVTNYSNSFGFDLELSTLSFSATSNVGTRTKAVVLTFFTSIDSSYLQLAQNVSFAAEVIGLTILVLSIFINRMLGLELIAVLQTGLFMLATMVYVPEILNSLTSYSLAINGYNRLFQNFPVIPYGIPVTYTYNNIPYSLKNVGAQAEFLYNVNYMLGINIGLFALGLLMKLLRFPKKLTNFVFQDLFFGFAVFNSMNIGFSMGAHLNYFTRDSNSFYINNIILLAALAVLIVAAFNYTAHTSEEFIGYTQHYKQKYVMHPVFHLGHKFAIGLTISMFNQFPKLCYVVTVLTAVYLLYVLLFRPYENMLLQFRAVIDEGVIVLISATALYYQNYSDNQIVNNTQYLAWLTLAMMFVAVGLNGIILVVELYRRCTQKKVDNAVPQFHDEQPGLGKSPFRAGNESRVEIIQFENVQQSVDSSENNTKRKIKRKIKAYNN